MITHKTYKWFLLFVCFAMSVSCVRVYEIPEVRNPILPLENGNTWTYEDSIYVYRDEALIWTGESEVTMYVYDKGYVDRKILDFEKAKYPDAGRYLRIPVTQVAYDVDGLLTVAEVWPQEEGISYPEYWDPLAFGAVGVGDCRHGDINNRAFSFSDPYEERYFVKYPAMIGDTATESFFFWKSWGCTNLFAVAPGLNFQSILYPVEAGRIVLQDTTTEVTVPAGTFTTHNYGSQQWVPGIGPVSGEINFELVYGSWDSANVVDTFQAVHRRRLVSYTIN